MNMDAITLEDCMDMFEKLGKTTIIISGHVIGFQKESGIYEKTQ